MTSLTPQSPCKDLVQNVERKIWLDIEQTMLPATAYTMLAISALWSFILQISTRFPLSIGFLTILLHFATGVFGAWHYINLCNKVGSPTIRYCLKISKFVSYLYTLPLLVSDLYIKYKFSIELIFAHLFLPLLALVPHGSHGPVDRTILRFKKLQSLGKVKDTLDFVTFCCVVSLTIISTLGNNIFGVMAAFVYAITHFIITDEGYIDRIKMPAEPIYISGMGVFCLLGMRAMTER